MDTSIIINSVMTKKIESKITDDDDDDKVNENKAMIFTINTRKVNN